MKKLHSHIAKLQTAKDKEKILTASREEKKIIFKRAVGLTLTSELKLKPME